MIFKSIRRVRPNRLLSALLALSLLAVPGSLQGGFDPSNDDTDLFLSNPAVASSDRPNVLIVLDNTANWNQPYANEKSALVSVVNGLDDSFNVGLLLFPEPENPNDNRVGGYVRFAVRQMTGANRVVLSSVVNGLHKLQDKGNNATTALAMYESYLYYAGKASNASYGKVKTDYTGNTSNPANPLGDHALGSNPNSSSLYNSPISNGCQKNFIIYISNGPANENSNALRTSERQLEDLTDTSPPNVISISPSGQQGNWADEWADFMANADVNSNVAEAQNVYTYTLEVDRKTTGQGPAMTALLKSMANKGKGRYFSVSSSNGGLEIIEALNQIFQEVKAVNSVFAATTLPVSVNVRGTNLNQVYVGMFRPDSMKRPRWSGNLQCYQLGLDANTGELYLSDAKSNKAENSSTGFITTDAESFWTKDSDFWGFRTDEENGSGGASDLPDGDLVEKGGVAQNLRTSNAASRDNRNFFSCFGSCATGSLLSEFQFSVDNVGGDDLIEFVQAENSFGAGMSLGDTIDLINWIRGQDNFEDENANSSSTDARASIHSDVLHSKPAIINYNRRGDDNDIMAFYGANDGVFRAVKGGFDSPDGEAAPGEEVWGFIPEEFFGRLKRLRDNDPIISSVNKKPYFADGSIGTYVLDNNKDGIIKETDVDGDKAHLFISMRRGGRMIYALDVSTPTAPKMMWKRDNEDDGYYELGYTWSEPKVVTDLAASSDPVLIFGAGYDPEVEDIPPTDIAAVSASAVTDLGGNGHPRTMGRGVFVVNALCGGR